MGAGTRMCRYCSAQPFATPLPSQHTHEHTHIHTHTRHSAPSQSLSMILHACGTLGYKNRLLLRAACDATLDLLPKVRAMQPNHATT